MERKHIDWEAVEREYRAGQLSIREIGAQYSVSHTAINNKAKAQGWKRDLSKRVKDLVSSKLLVAGQVSNDNVRDEEIVEQAAERAIQIISLHREGAKKQQGIIDRLMTILNVRVNADIEPTFDELRISGTMLRDCSQAFTKLVGIERQAYGIDNGSTETGGVTVIVHKDGNRDSSPD